MKLFIDTEKSLQYSDELGWNWHKSWNLPNISVRLEVFLSKKKKKNILFYFFYFTTIFKKRLRIFKHKSLFYLQKTST